MIDVLFSIILGILIGFGGLIPGFHINLISVFLFSISGIFLSIFTPIGAMSLIVSAAISSNFFEFVKSGFLMTPSEGASLSVHPMKLFFEKGRILEAINLCLIGGIFSIFIGICFLPLIVFLFPFVYDISRRFIIFTLLFISIHLIFKEESKVKALFIFLISGMFGLFVLAIKMNQPLLPLLTGMFGISSLIDFKKKKFSQMKNLVTYFDKRQVIKGGFMGFLSASLICFIPALGPAQASILISEFEKKRDPRLYLIGIGGTNTCDVLFSLVALFLFGKARIGAFDFIRSFFRVEIGTFLILVFVMLISAIISFIICIELSKKACEFFQKVNYKHISILVILLVSFLTFMFDGLIGILVLMLSTGIGYLANYFKVKMSNCMSCLILPTIFNFVF